MFNIVLHEPEIPNNTGNIGRTCIATHCALHLIRPLGFDTSEKACRRAGLDYWPRLNPLQHDSFDHYLASTTPQRLWLFTTKSTRPTLGPAAPRFLPGDHLVFGKETKGLPDHLLARYPDQLLTLPMAQGERSLNLATAVCAVIYLALDQLLRDGTITLDAAARLTNPTTTLQTPKA